jgi:hypothetical protein
MPDPSTSRLVQLARFVDLAAQVAPLVLGHAAAAAVDLLFLLLALVVGRADVGLARAAILLRLLLLRWQVEAFGTLSLLVVLIVAAVELLGDCAPGCQHQGARHRSATRGTGHAACLRLCLLVGKRTVHGVPLPRCHVRE